MDFMIATPGIIGLAGGSGPIQEGFVVIGIFGVEVSARNDEGGVETEGLEGLSVASCEDI